MANGQQWPNVPILLFATRHSLYFDRHVSIGGVADIAQIVDFSCVAPDRLADLLLRPVHFSVDGFDLDLAFGERHDDVGQVVAMQALALARLHRKLPHTHVLVLEDHTVADRAELHIRIQHAWLLFMPLSLSWPGLSRPSRLEKHNLAHLSGITGTSPVMTMGRGGAGFMVTERALAVQRLPHPVGDAGGRRQDGVLENVSRRQ